MLWSVKFGYSGGSFVRRWLSALLASWSSLRAGSREEAEMSRFFFGSLNLAVM